MRWILTGFFSTLSAIIVAGGLLWWLNIHSPMHLANQPISQTGSVENSAETSVTTPAPTTPTSSNPSPSNPNTPAPLTQHSLSVADIPALSVGSSGHAVTRLQQLLAELGYLPVEWTSIAPEQLTTVAQLSYTQSPPDGHWRFRFSSTPSALQAQWKPGEYNVLTKGAVMAFQQVNHLETDGVAGPQVWSALVQARLQQHHNPYDYAYVYVSMHQPQKLSIWSNGKVVLTTLVNTGISVSPTTTGTHPVYLQYRTQTMTGTDPSGQHYSDPGVPWVSYFYGGEAVHGFVRSSYGSPQSLGCIELPPQKAAEAWKYIHIGTLVTVIGP